MTQTTMNRRSRRLIALALVILAVTVAAVLGSAWLSPDCAGLATRGARFDTAVVLGASGKGETGRLRPDSRNRTLAAVELYKQGVVTHLHFTGTAAPPAPEAAALSMRELAVASGVPMADTSVETESKSTLENARFSLPMLEDAGTLLLVSEGFHLWRGAASMAWAGRPVAATCSSAPFAPERSATNRVWTVTREAAAWWLNILRGGVFSVATAFGVENHLPEAFLE